MGPSSSASQFASAPDDDGSLLAAVMKRVSTSEDCDLAANLLLQLKLLKARESSLLHHADALERRNVELQSEVNFLTVQLLNANRVLDNHWNSRLWKIYVLYRRIMGRKRS